MLHSLSKLILKNEMKKKLANLKPQDIRIASHFINQPHKGAIKLHEWEKLSGGNIIRYQNHMEFYILPSREN